MLEVELEQPDELEREDAEEDDEVERPGGKPSAKLAEDPRASELPDEPHRADDPEQPEDAKRRHAAEEVEDAATVAEITHLVAAVSRRKVKSIRKMTVSSTSM